MLVTGALSSVVCVAGASPALLGNNLGMIETADWIVHLTRRGRDEDRHIVTQGMPEEVA